MSSSTITTSATTSIRLATVAADATLPFSTNDSTDMGSKAKGEGRIVATMSPLPEAAPPRPVVLLILDGFGSRPDAPDNAITRARMPRWRELLASSANGTIDASEMHVGLPDGQMGNSEVGHLNIGAGRVVYQDLTRIDQAIATGEFARSPVLLGTGWLRLKLALVVLLVGYHAWLFKLVRDFAAGRNRHGERWYRWFNEIPTLLLIAIVLLAVARPF